MTPIVKHSIEPYSRSRVPIDSEIFPKEVIVNIFLYLNSYKPLMITCRRFYDVLSSEEVNILWTRLLRCYFPDSFKDDVDTKIRPIDLYRYYSEAQRNMRNQTYDFFYCPSELSENYSPSNTSRPSSFFKWRGIYMTKEGVKIVDPKTKIEVCSITYPEQSRTVDLSLQNDSVYVYSTAGPSNSDIRTCTVQIFNLKTREEISSKTVLIKLEGTPIVQRYHGGLYLGDGRGSVTKVDFDSNKSTAWKAHKHSITCIRYYNGLLYTSSRKSLKVWKDEILVVKYSFERIKTFTVTRGQFQIETGNSKMEVCDFNPPSYQPERLLFKVKKSDLVNRGFSEIDWSSTAWQNSPPECNSQLFSVPWGRKISDLQVVGDGLLCFKIGKKKIIIWDLKIHTIFSLFTVNKKDKVYVDGDCLYLINTTQIKIFDLKTKKWLETLEGVQGRLLSLITINEGCIYECFSNSIEDPTLKIKILDCKNGEVLKIFNLPNLSVLLQMADQLYVYGKFLYLVTLGRIITIVDLEQEIVIKTVSSGDIEPINAILMYNGFLYINSEDRLNICTLDGLSIRSYPHGNSPCSGLTINNGVIYLAKLGNIHAYRSDPSIVVDKVIKIALFLLSRIQSNKHQ